MSDQMSWHCKPRGTLRPEAEPSTAQHSKQEHVHNVTPDKALGDAGQHGSNTGYWYARELEPSACNFRETIVQGENRRGYSAAVHATCGSVLTWS